MADEFYLVKIGTVNLTDDGTGTGAACLNQVQGLSSLFLARNGNTIKACDGTPRNFTFENEGKGVNLITKPFVIKSDVLDDLKTLINASFGGSDIAVQVSDGPGAANVDCKPLFENGIPPLNFGPNFSDDDLYDVEIRLVTTGFTAP
jgi:hypothetical protein